MGKFRMRCPKCGSFNLDLERDYRGSSARGPHQVQLHCFTCGKVIYGEKAVQEEYERQLVTWEADRRSRVSEQVRSSVAAAPKPAPAPAPAEAAPTEAPVVSAAEPAAREPEVSVVPSSDALPEWWNWPLNEITLEMNPKPPGWVQCAWDSCERGRRPRSKYCSRNCSNKNARARHAKRKKD